MPRSISNSLVSWYRENKRDLPWRHTADPYAILVSEFMLQQTRVSAVIPFYLRFLSRFPTVADLASAPESEALAMWAGLGYYRRLRNLQASATVIAETGWPKDLESLPGVGKYTAAAVGSIAMSGEQVCVDGNVRRVWSRFLAKDCSFGEAERQSIALISHHRASEWNQAVMELGAVICKPKQPECSACPISVGCKSFRLGGAEKYPLAKAKRRIQLDEVYACAVRANRVGVRKCLPGEWWQGMYTFPRIALAKGKSGKETVQSMGMGDPEYLGQLTHTVTQHRINVQAFVGELTEEMGLEWQTLTELALLPMPSPARRVAKWLESAL